MTRRTTTIREAIKVLTVMEAIQCQHCLAKLPPKEKIRDQINELRGIENEGISARDAAAILRDVIISIATFRSLFW